MNKKFISIIVFIVAIALLSVIVGINIAYERRIAATASGNLRFNGKVPRIDIFTRTPFLPIRKSSYCDCTVFFSSPESGKIETKKGKIRGRGNATWKKYPKKPYKLKLQEAFSPFGLGKEKDWVLLAEYTDRSLLRSAVMSEVGKVLDMPYSIEYIHVDLYINGDYEGTYLLTEQVERGKKRIDIPKHGIIIEHDHYYNKETCYFTTKRYGFHYTFKHPKRMKQSSMEYNQVKDLMNSFEEALYKIPSDSLSYLDYIDVKSFARWFIAQELLGNWEPNVYYVLKDEGDKLTMTPLWDAEWSLGATMKGNKDDKHGFFTPPHPVDKTATVWTHQLYFTQLLQEARFRNTVKEQWNSHREKLTQLPYIIRQTAKRIRISQKQNFRRWPILGQYIKPGLTALPTWEAETDYLLDVYNSRITHMDSIVKSF